MTRVQTSARLRARFHAGQRRAATAVQSAGRGWALCALAGLSVPAHAVSYTWLSGDYVAAGMPNPLAAGDVVTATGPLGKGFATSVTLNGRLDWQSTSTISFNGTGTTLRNNGVVDIALDNWIRPFGSNNLLDNAGTLRKSGGTGELLVDTLLTNRSGGVLDAAAGTIRYRNSGTLEGGTVFTGAGTHRFETVNTYTFTGGFSGAANNVYFERGTFVSTSGTRLDPATNLNWSGGVLQGNWGNAAGRTVTVTSGFDKTYASSYTNAGTVAWTTGDSLFLNGANTTLRNDGLFDFSQNSWIRPFGSNNLFDNAGTLRKSGGTGDLRIDGALRNTGAIESLAGNIALPDNWRNDGVLRGTAAYSSTRLTNAGVIAPGLAGAPNIATLRVTGALQQAVGGQLNFDVGGSGGGSDLLAVTGAVSFAGRVLVQPVGGYVPQVGDSFLVMTYASFSGSLGEIAWQGFGDGVAWTAVVLPTSLRLQVSAVPEPSAWLLCLGGAAALAWRMRRAGSGRAGR